MTNNQLETAPAPKDAVQQNDNTAHLQAAAYSGNSGDLNTGLNRTNDVAQNTVDNKFGGLQLLDGGTPVKAATDLAKDWDSAAKSGDYSTVNKEMTSAFQQAFKEEGGAGVTKLGSQLETMTNTANSAPIVQMNDHTITIHNARQLSDKEAETIPHLYDKRLDIPYTDIGPSTTFNVPPSAAEAHTTSLRPAIQAEINGNKIAGDLKAEASDNQIANDIQDALRNGASLDMLVSSVNKHAAEGSSNGSGNGSSKDTDVNLAGPHLELSYRQDGFPNLTLKRGLMGGRQMVIDGNNVTVGGAYR